MPLVWSGQTQLKYMLVPMFFAVSGFLVTGSAFRTQSLKTFLIFRLLRILPALTTEVFLSALILGPILTTVSLHDYFSDPWFFKYFGNIAGRVWMLLPGVFMTNPAAGAVNVNLWTLPSEFYCYLIIAVLLVTGLLARRAIFSFVFAISTVCLVTLNLADSPSIQEISLGFGLSKTLLVYYFFCGCLIYHWKDRVPFHGGLFAISCALSYFLYVAKLVYIAPLFVSYIIIYIGMIKFPRIELIQRGDYSYGVYLYGFPIVQSVICLFPNMIGHGWWVLCTAGSLTFLFAVMSWHLIEKPTLSLKKFFASRPALATETETVPAAHSGVKARASF